MMLVTIVVSVSRTPRQIMHWCRTLTMTANPFGLMRRSSSSAKITSASSWSAGAPRSSWPHAQLCCYRSRLTRQQADPHAANNGNKVVRARRFASLLREQVDLRALLHFGSPHDAPGPRNGRLSPPDLRLPAALALRSWMISRFPPCRQHGRSRDAIRCHPLCCVAPPTFEQ